MKWNQTHYGGVKSVRLPIDRIWQPDITLYRGKSELMDGHLMPVVYSDGTVSYLPKMEVQVKCDKTKDPDSWSNGMITTCELKTGSWTYDGSKLNATLSSNPGIPDWPIHANNKYNLIDFTAKRNVVIYECCPEPYIDITFTAIFK